MSVPIRLNDNLVHEAESEGLIHKRSTPKQIEYWAEIGKLVARSANSSDLLALTQGFAQVKIALRHCTPVDPETVLAALENERDDGALSRTVTQAKVWYEASQTHPGLLDRVQANGQREAGRFRHGEFLPRT